MAELKTFVFTDISGSVRMKDAMPGRSASERDQAFIETILTPHRQRIENELAAHGGRVVSTAGDGHFLVFSDTILAACWAIAVQRNHHEAPLATPTGEGVALRVSIHVGIPQTDPHDPNNFVGKPVDYAARLNDYAAAGQILVSRSVVAILEDAGMDDVRFHDHGRRELKGIGSVDVYELILNREKPHATRDEPAAKHARQWTVVPPQSGLTEQYSLGRGAPMATGSTVAPRRLGNYELGLLLGSGGMGDVYQARHSQFGRLRAVKVIKQHFVDAGHEEVIRRFYREIKAVGTLEHPNIVVAIESSAPTDDVHFLVMEYIDGVSVDQLISLDGQLGVAEACEIARQTALGLEYIHQHRMVHRDVKPSNLMLTSVARDESPGIIPTPNLPDSRHQGETQSGGRAVVKILDLGLALLVGDDQQRLTRFDDRPIGTGMYMAPEQWQTTSVDIRADIYGLGCTLYHMLAGRPPFADSDLRPRRAHEKEKLPPINRPEKPIGRHLWRILEKMTAKRPEDRYQSPAEVAAALAPFCQDHNLVSELARHRQCTAQAATKRMMGSDTWHEMSAETDTRPVRQSLRDDTGQHARFERARFQQPKSHWRRLAKVLGAAALCLLTIWLAVLAGRRMGTVEETQEKRFERLQTYANVAAKGIADNIDRRFDILKNLVTREELLASLRQHEIEPDDRVPWSTLGDWISKRKSEFDAQVGADSWFINDTLGYQVAREPFGESVGENFAHRDYFHGLGYELDETSGGPRQVEPLETPHQSAVYRSSTSGHPKVAFSVPIWNGEQVASRKNVLGVLSMSVDLGDFNVLDKVLPAGHKYQVVLVDMGDFAVDEATGRGLVMHHSGRDPPGKDDPLPVIGPALRQRLEAILADDDAHRVTVLENYQDPVVTDGRICWGAFQRVDARPRRGEDRATNWVVLVQEPATP